MTVSSVTKVRSSIIHATEVSDGAGVRLKRTIGSTVLRHLDPFLMLDYFSSDNPSDYIAGFPSHPHRGFATFTYMIEGDMEHKDSMGNTGNLGSGGGQWMKAGSGVIHSEMPKQEDGLMRGYQLWINLPAANKFDPPEYQEYKSASFPVVDESDTTVKVIIGNYGDVSSPIQDDITQVSYYDVQVSAGKYFNISLINGRKQFLTVFEGSGEIDGKTVNVHSLVSLDGDNESIDFVAGEMGARFILVSGKPINEPIVQYGPFVMNTKEEIDQAMRDYENNDFVRDRAWVNRK